MQCGYILMCFIDIEHSKMQITSSLDCPMGQILLRLSKPKTRIILYLLNEIRSYFYNYITWQSCCYFRFTLLANRQRNSQRNVGDLHLKLATNLHVLSNCKTTPVLLGLSMMQSITIKVNVHNMSSYQTYLKRCTLWV